jgi:uncharacterized membrane protein
VHPHPGPPDFESAAVPFFGFPVFLLMLVLTVALVAFLWRSGRIEAWLSGGRPSPERAAQQVLAERFARGDLSPEEFMERASVLNWTPGVPAERPGGRRRVGRR